MIPRPAPSALALGLALALLPACASSGPDPVAEARALQTELRRAVITTRSLGRFGELALFEQELEKAPCRPPLSDENRLCEVALAGKGPVRMRVADLELEKAGHVRKHALVWVEYQPDCDNQRFDFKTVDNVLPRGPTRDGVTVWENKLLRVTHRRVAAPSRDQCTLTIEAAPPLLTRIKAMAPAPLP
ncbi:MAG: hypothetical protein HY901_32020 [Deltaproteobacteria bacterium]|nr:hypothetical protein [Deltaproteobacteria bacterium]